MPHCLEYWNFIVTLEVRKCQFSNFVFLLQYRLLLDQFLMNIIQKHSLLFSCSLSQLFTFPVVLTLGRVNKMAFVFSFFFITLRKFYISCISLLILYLLRGRSWSFYVAGGWVRRGGDPHEYFWSNSRCSLPGEWLAYKPSHSNVSQFFPGPDPFLWSPEIGQIVLNTEDEFVLQYGLKIRRDCKAKIPQIFKDPKFSELYFLILVT